MGFDKKIGNNYFVVKNNMVYANEWCWTDTHYRVFSFDGDALARTSLAYIAYGEEELFDGICSCFHEVDTHNTKGIYVSRNNSMGVSYLIDYDRFQGGSLTEWSAFGLFVNTSRDQVLYALTALKLRGKDEIVKKYVSGLTKQLSLSYKQTIDFNFWLKEISGEKVFPYHFITFLLSYVMIKYWNPFTFVLETQSWYMKILNRFKIQTNDTRVYGFSFLMAVLQLVTSKPHGIWRKYWAKKLLKITEKSNLMIRLMLGDNIEIPETINGYSDVQWQRFKESWENIDNKLLPQERLQSNFIDYDILLSCKRIGEQINNNTENIRL